MLFAVVRSQSVEVLEEALSLLRIGSEESCVGVEHLQLLHLRSGLLVVSAGQDEHIVGYLGGRLALQLDLLREANVAVELVLDRKRESLLRFDEIKVACHDAADVRHASASVLVIFIEFTELTVEL